MTQARTRANGVGSPSLPQLLLTAMLRAFVVIVQSVVSTFQMNRNRPPRDWRTGQAQVLQPRTKSDTQQQETIPVAASDNNPIALILRSASQMRVSKDDGVLTTASSTLAQHGDLPPPPLGGG